MPRLSNSCKQVWLTKGRFVKTGLKPKEAVLRKKCGKKSLGQSTIEYLLMVAFGALFSLQIVKFFNDIFREGLQGLETNIQAEVQTGQGFGGNAE